VVGLIYKTLRKGNRILGRS